MLLVWNFENSRYERDEFKMSLYGYCKSMILIKRILHYSPTNIDENIFTQTLCALLF